MRKLLGSTFFWLALMLIVGESVSWWLLPYRLCPSADVAVRNPNKHRAWPEYLNVNESSKPLVVLLSNSQGVGGEMDDPESTYAGILRKHLEAKGYRFENWSTGGLRTVELELLTLKAKQRGADHVLMVLTLNNFDPPDKMTLDFPFSDIPLLAGEPALWNDLSNTLTGKSATIEDIISRFARCKSNLARSRIAVMDLVASHVSLKWHPLTLGHEVRPGFRLDGMKDPDLSIYFPVSDVGENELLKRRALKAKKKKHWEKEAVSKRLDTFNGFYVRFRDRLNLAGMGQTWVWNPLSPTSTTDEGVEARDWFIERASKTIKENGAIVHNMTDAFEADYFLTWGHFDRKGHREFAQKLANVLDNELGKTEGKR